MRVQAFVILTDSLSVDERHRHSGRVYSDGNAFLVSISLYMAKQGICAGYFDNVRLLWCAELTKNPVDGFSAGLVDDSYVFF